MIVRLIDVYGAAYCDAVEAARLVLILGPEGWGKAPP